LLALSFHVWLITAGVHGGPFRPAQVNYLQPQSAVSADPLAHVAGIVRPQILIARAANLIAPGCGIPGGVKLGHCPRCDAIWFRGMAPNIIVHADAQVPSIAAILSSLSSRRAGKEGSSLEWSD
jgi:hypothetical protein